MICLMPLSLLKWHTCACLSYHMICHVRREIRTTGYTLVALKILPSTQIIQMYVTMTYEHGYSRTAISTLPVFLAIRTPNWIIYDVTFWHSQEDCRGLNRRVSKSLTFRAMEIGNDSLSVNWDARAITSFEALQKAAATMPIDENTTLLRSIRMPPPWSKIQNSFKIWPIY